MIHSPRLLLRNARIEGGEPVDLDIEHGMIVGIGPGIGNGLGLGLGLAGAESIDLEGRHVLPGLWDNHVHLTQQALARRRVDLSAAVSALDAASIMGAAMKTRPPETGMPLVGCGFRDGLWPDTPTATVLDSATGDLATVLISGDLHCCWLNTAALNRFGFGADHDGILREDHAFRIVKLLEDVPDGVLDVWVAEAAQAAAARGVVGVVDFEMADNITVWSRRIADGADRLRVAAGIYTEHLDAAIATGYRTGAVIPNTAGLLTVGPFKILIDGSLNTRTALCVDEYPGLSGHPHSHGMLTVSPDALESVIRRASGAGILPAVHAIGDEANRIALDAFDAVGCHGRIEHAQLLRDADLQRFAALGISASVQPEQAMDDRDVADHYWANRTERAFPLRSLLDAGATIVLGSDAPVAPLDPWVTISAAVGRARDGRDAWHPEQAISIKEALDASTNGTPSVVIGAPADLCVVENNPLTATAASLRSMPVSATLVAGRVTYSALGLP